MKNMKTFLTNEEREARDVINSQWFAKFQTYDWDNMDKRDRKRAYKDVYKCFKQSIPSWYKIISYFSFYIWFLAGIISLIVAVTGSPYSSYTAIGKDYVVLGWTWFLVLLSIIFTLTIIRTSKHTKDWKFFLGFMSSYR